MRLRVVSSLALSPRARPPSLVHALLARARPLTLVLALGACLPASARAPYRAKNALVGGALLAFVAGVFAYALAAVKQDTFEDLDDAARRAAMNTEDERRAMQMAAAHATAGAGGANGMGATTTKEAPRPARLSERTPGGAAAPIPASTLAPVEKEKPTPHGVFPALLERRAPWLLNPTQKTLVWGAPPVVSIWTPCDPPRLPQCPCRTLVPSCPPFASGIETLTDDFLRYASLAVTLVGALTHSFLTVQLSASWRTPPLRALDAESELDAWKLDSLKSPLGAPRPLSRAAALVSFVGFFGLWCPAGAPRLSFSLSHAFFCSLIFHNKPSHVRLYDDCSTADLAFTAFLTVLAAYAAWAPGRLACEERAQLLSPDETCERAAVSLLAGMLVPSVIRLHFLLAVSTHYAHLVATATAPGGRARGQREGVGPRAAEADAGLLDARVVHSKRE
ncbi:hypothetical protein FB451DRAFT_1527646 [Mycena latifolia]|nr:hypothetical protein FB451DRAFT_1527646 [Mycena latifolia]